LFVAASVLSLALAVGAAPSIGEQLRGTRTAGIKMIEHIIVVVQENRSPVPASGECRKATPGPAAPPT
jgi:phospholipase C